MAENVRIYCANCDIEVGYDDDCPMGCDDLINETETN